MKRKARIYIPTKTPMQSAKGNSQKWVLEYELKDRGVNPLMGWETSNDTMSEIKLDFSSKELAIDYAKKNNYRILHN